MSQIEAQTHEDSTRSQPPPVTPGSLTGCSERVTQATGRLAIFSPLSDWCRSFTEACAHLDDATLCRMAQGLDSDRTN
jgi:hypothetical protein